jgi:hypothetical protein
MESGMKRILFVAALLCHFLPAADGGVVVNSNFILTSFAPKHTFTALQNEAGTDPTSLSVALSGQTLTPLSWNVDEEADYYMVPNLAVFSEATISLGLFQPLFVVDHPSSLTLVLGIFTWASIRARGLQVPGSRTAMYSDGFT